MKKNLRHIILMLMFAVPFLAKATITITIVSPKNTGYYNTDVSVHFTVDSSNPINTATATVGSQVATLTSTGGKGPFAYTYDYIGTVNLGNLPEGVLSISISATDASQNTQTTSFNFNYNKPAVINVISPLANSSVQSSIKINVNITDPGKASCSGKVTGGSLNIPFTNAINTQISIASQGLLNLVITATDDVNQVTSVTVPVYIDNSAFLTPYYSGTTQILDFKDTRLLTTNGNGIYQIINVLDNTSVTIPFNPAVTANSIVSGILCNGGAAFNVKYDQTIAGDNYTFFIFKDGVLNNISGNMLSIGSMPVAAGNYVGWYDTSFKILLTSPATLQTINTGVFANTPVTYSADGNLAYQGRNLAEVYKYSVGSNTETKITNSVASGFINFNPIIDNNNIVYTKNKLPATIYPPISYLYDGVSETKLGQVENGGNLKYRLAGGYVGYTDLDKANVEQIWLRTPNNVTKQVSFFPTNSDLDVVTPSGGVIFKNGTNRYYTDNLTAPTAISSTSGTIFYVNNNYYLALGNSLYRYDLTVPVTTPTISSISPVNAATGATVTINGTGFNGITSVSFGGVTASTFTVVSSTMITAVVGIGASGNVTVTNSAGTGSIAGFSYNIAPFIQSFSPTSAGANQLVTITGANFAGATSVTFGGTAAVSFTINSATSITAKIGTGSSGSVSVTTANGTGTATGFTFISPTIASISPVSAKTGETVTITGTNFIGVTDVSFGGIAASSFTVNSATSITATLSEGASGNVTVTAAGGTVAKPGFIYVASPVITSFSPAGAGGGQVVTITGVNFTNATAVSFGGVAAKSFIVNSARSITATVAAGASGSVSVTNPIGTGTNQGFTYLLPPTITSFTPYWAGGERYVIINGTNFTGVTAVSLGGVPAAALTISLSTLMTVKVGAGATGDIVVTAPYGTASISGYVFPSALAIASISPTSAKAGQTITINGDNFTGATAVSFGGVAATSFTVNSATSISAVVGTGASGSVSVTTPNGTATLAGFIYLPPPAIAAFTPTSAGTGTSISITGSNFTGATAVTLGGMAATSFTINSATSITAVVGAGTSGNVAVTTANGTATLAGFSYLQPGITISGTTAAFTGILGTASAPTSVNVSGANLYSSVLAVAPAGFELSTDNIIFSTSTTIGTPAGFINLPLYVRLSATAVAGANSGNIVVSAPGAVTQNIAVTGAVTFALPASNFKLTNTSATCKGSTNGSINITAVQNLNYTATLTNTAGGASTTYPFTTSTTINNLPAGTYNVCMTVAGQLGYQQCFTSVITEPKDLAVYASVIPSTNQAVLSLSGGDTYHINLNGVTSTTTAGQVTLTLRTGANQISVSTDKDCQGVVNKIIMITDGVTLFPNPFTNNVSLNLGNDVIKDATVRIYDAFSKVVYSSKYINQSGIVKIDLSTLTPGVYMVQWTSGDTQTTHKIIKN